MGTPERDEAMGLLTNLRLALVHGGPLPEEAQVPGAMRRPMGEHGEPVASPADTAAAGAQRVCEQEAARQHGAEP